MMYERKESDDKMHTRKQNSRGWYGEPRRHARAGMMSPTKFQMGSELASAAGQKGGIVAQRTGRAHKLTRKERSRGGKIGGAR